MFHTYMKFKNQIFFRTYIKSDIVHRILSDYFNIDVLMIMGITDIDDKIIKRAAESGKDFRDLSRHFEAEFFTDMSNLNIREPFLYCRVTDYVPQIIQFIEKLVANGYGYVTKTGTVSSLTNIKNCSMIKLFSFY